MSSEPSGTCERHCIISLRGELDLAAAPELRSELTALVGTNNNRAVVLDLAEVTFMDSSGVGAVLSTYRALLLQERRLVVANAHPIVARVLNLTNVDSIIPVRASVADAVDGCPLAHVARSVRRLDAAV